MKEMKIIYDLPNDAYDTFGSLLGIFPEPYNELVTPFIKTANALATKCYINNMEMIKYKTMWQLRSLEKIIVSVGGTLKISQTEELILLGFSEEVQQSIRAQLAQHR